MIERWFLGVFCLLVLASCGEQPHRYYENVDAAVASGEQSRGWLPAWLPRSATGIHLRGDLDTNQWWIRAELTPAAADSLRTMLEKVNAEEVRGTRPESGSGWWFEGLIQQQPANDNALQADLFRGTGTPVDSTIVVAFDGTSPAIFIWTDAIR